VDCHLAFAAFPFPAPIDRSQLINWHQNCLDNLHSVTRPQPAIETLRYKVLKARGTISTREISFMNNDAEFQMVCRDCGSLAIKIEDPVGASPETVVNCGSCGTSRGTMGALRDLATRLQALGRSEKLKSGSELVSLHRELQSLRRKVQTQQSTTEH
jgi:hypothetical protein